MQEKQDSTDRRALLIENLLQVVRESLSDRSEQELRAAIDTVRDVASGDRSIPVMRGPHGAVVAIPNPAATQSQIASDLYALGLSVDDHWQAPFGDGDPNRGNAAPN
jgi:hypothetical protein